MKPAKMFPEIFPNIKIPDKFTTLLVSHSVVSTRPTVTSVVLQHLLAI